MSNKLTKIGKSTLSLILCLTMLLTTFCFFDIGSVISEAMISKDEHALSAAGASSNAFSKYSINFPELVYTKPGAKVSQYFLNNDSSGNVEGTTSSTGNFDFNCSTAKKITISAKLYNENLTELAKNNSIATISFADGKSISGSNSLTINAGTYTTNIKSIEFNQAESEKQYIIEWQISYTVTVSGDPVYTTYAYTGVKFPSLRQAGLVQYQYYSGTYTSSTGQSSYSFIAGADSVNGGNAASAFTSNSSVIKDTSKISPLVTFIGSATNGTNYTMPTGQGVVTNTTYFPNTNNGGVFKYYDNSSRSKIWNIPQDGSRDYLVSTTATNPFVKSTYGNATISIDRSRFTDFNQIPNLSCGYAQFYHHWEGAGNKLYNIRNAVYGGSDAAKYWRDYKTENLSTNSNGAKSVSLYCNVDRANESSSNDNRSYVRGLYAINGAIPTSSGSTYMRFEAMNGYSPTIGYDENCVVIATVQLTYNVANKSSLRKAYYECMNSGVNNQANVNGGAQYWDQYLANLKTMAKELCVSTNTDVTVPTGYDSVITNAQNELKNKMTADVSAPVHFYVPEAIYLKPVINSYTAQTASTFQWFIQNTVNESDVNAVPTVKSGYDTSGNVYFHYANATGNVAVSSRWISSNNNSSVTLISGSASQSTSTSSFSKFTINASSNSPKLNAGETGCYIEWTAKYTDSTDNKEKTVTAYTYVYKPYVQPVGNAIDNEANRKSGHRRYGKSISWVSGVQGVLKNTDGSITNGVYYPKSEENNWGFVPFSSTNNSTISLQFPTRLKTDPNNAGAVNYTSESSSDFSDKSLNYIYVDGDDKDYDNSYVVAASPEALMSIDTSRYTNLNQIPNLSAGLIVTSNYNMDSGSWYVADSTNYDKRLSYSNVYNKDDWGTSTTYFQTVDENSIISIGGKLNDYSSSDAIKCGLKYNGLWNCSIGTTSDFYFQAAYIARISGRSSNSVSLIKLKTKLYNKSALRTAIDDAIANFANFGIYDSANMKSYYFEGTEYNSFVSAFKKACQALTKVDGTIDDPTTLAGTLNTCKDNLLKLKSLKTNCAAKQYNIGLVRQGDKYLAVDISAIDENPHVMSYNARDNVSFSPDKFDGYTYSGSVELTSDSLTNGNGIETIYGSYLGCVDNKPNIIYLTEGNKGSSEIKLSGSTITVDKTSTITTTVPTFEGDTIHYNWVAAVNDPSLTVVSFYVLNPDVLFDNEFDFDEIPYSNGSGLSTIFADYAANSLYLVNTKNDSYINDSSSRMKLIPGHTYRVLYNFSSTNGGRSRCTIMPYTATTGGSYTNHIDNLASGGTFTVAESNPYIFVRFGVLNPSGVDASKGGYNGTYSDIYVQDITNIKGVNDDVSEASPHGLYNRTPGSTLDTVANISRTGYQFDGWFDSQDETGNGTGTQYTAESKVPYTNLKLFSKWTANKITLKYDGNNRTDGVTVPDQTFEYGDSVTTAKTPVREYTVNYNAMNGTVNPTSDTAQYTFAGWKSSINGGDKFDEKLYYKANTAYTDSFGATEGTVTLTAMWKDGGLTLPTPTRTGYTFGGWYTDSGCTNAVTLTDGMYYATSNTTLYAKWTAHQYTVKYDGNGNTSGSTASSSHTFDVPKTLTKNGYGREYTVTYNYNGSGAANTSTKATATFNGWATSKTGAKIYNDQQKVVNLTDVDGATVTLYANWTLASITTPTPTRTGYTFGGWYKEAGCINKVVDGSKLYTPSGNITLYAKWTANKYKVHFDANKGTGTMDDQEFTYDQEQALTANAFTRAGYTFAGWNTQADGKGTSFGNGEKVKNLATSGTITLYAQWTANKITVHFNKNHSDATGTMSDQTFTYDKAQNLSSNGFSRSYAVTYNSNKPSTASTTPSLGKANDTATYTFSKWNNQADGKGTYSYGNGVSVTNPNGATSGETTLYAQWNPGSVTLPNATMTGYIFGGWYSDAACKNFVGNAGGTYTPTAATTLYAKWTANTYTVTLDQQGGSGGTTSVTATFDSDLPTITVPTRTGYTFGGYFTGTNGTGTQYYDVNGKGTKKWDIASKTTLYAKWTSHKYTVEYNGNGSTSGSTASSSHTFDVPKNLTANGFNRNYTVSYYDGSTKLSFDSAYTNGSATFQGWSLTSTGAKKYADKDIVVNLTDKDGGTVTLYAVWSFATVKAPSYSKGNLVFLGWSSTNGGEVKYIAGSEISNIKSNITLYAVWIDKATADSNAGKYGGTTVTYGYDATTGNALTKSLAEALTGDNLSKYNDYIKAVNAYKVAVDKGKSTVTNAENYRKAAADLASITNTINGIKVVSFLENMTVTYSMNGKTETKTGATVRSINLNHYSDGTLNTISSSYKTAKDKTKLTLAYQNEFNGYVEAVAKAYTNLDAIGSELKYDVNETSKSVAAQLGKNEDVEAISYVRTDYGPTYYCYTNSKEPKIVINALENPKSSTARIGYPTRFSASSDQGTDSYTVVNKTTGNAYSAYTNAGTYAIGNAYSENINGENLSGAAYYSAYSQIQLKPTFTTDKQTVSYTLSATDDALVKENNGLYTGKNYAKTTYLAGTQRTADTGENITIIISYHNSMGIFKATPAQVGSDVVLNQYHLFRTAAGASNWELPKAGDTMYSVDHGEYGQCGLGSFTYTFDVTNSSSGYTFDFDKCTIGVPNATDKAKVDKEALKNAIIAKLDPTKDKDGKTITSGNPDYSRINSMSAKLFQGAKYWTKVSPGNYEVHYGTGLGYCEWGNNWSYNYYPKSNSFTYVHLVDRWGNTFDAVYYVNPMDYKDVYAKTKTNTLGAYDIIESGGSGIATLTLNAAGFEILTDENSVMENNVFRTNGNTIRIKTGEANKSYTLNMTDKATNASTATVTSDENGIITLSITDEEYKSGVYTFKFNDTEINLYDKVNNHKYILEVQNAEVEEGETAELVVITTGEVIKARITDAYGNTKTITDYKQNDDGTRTWTFAKNLSAGEYDYDVTVKVGTYTWAEGSVAGKIKVNARILDSGRIISAEYDPATNLYKVKVEGRGTKVQFITPDGMTRTYTRHNVTVKSITSYDADGEETNDTSVTLDYEVWMIDAKLASKLKYKVVGKFEAGWNRADDAVTYVVAN